MRLGEGLCPVSYDRRTRDRFRLVVTGVTGGVGVGALTATGLLMGLASRDMADQQADQPDQQPTNRPQQAKPDRPPRPASSEWPSAAPPASRGCGSGRTSPG